MTDGKNRLVARNFTAIRNNRAKLSVFGFYIRHGGIETNLTAVFNYCLSHADNNIFQHIGAHVRLTVVEYFVFCTVVNKNPQNRIASFVIHPCGKLSVGKRTGAALTELNI